MKNIIIGVVLSILATACNNASNTATEKKSDTTQTANNAANSTKQSNTSGSTSINEIVAHYIEIKNALANDNGKEAATHGKAIVQSFENFDKASLTDAQKKVYDDAADDAKEMAEHIAASGDKIEHQREHFDMLSTDMYDLIKVFKPEQTLYKDHCPMYNSGKGAIWLSEVKEIKNPYLGKKMPTCGTVKEEIK